MAGRQVSGYESAAGLDVARELIPAHVRRWIYAGVSLAGYALAAIAVGLTTAGVDVPTSVTVALAVLGAMTGPVGQLAATNVPTTVPLPDNGEGQPDGALT